MIEKAESEAKKQEHEEDEEEGDEEGLELLDMLCDGVEADQHQENRKATLAKMNKEMDKRLNVIKMKKINKEKQEMERHLHKGAQDQKTGILIMKDSRVLTEDELLGEAGNRKFVEVMQMDMFETRNEHASTHQSKGFYTIGVLSDVSKPITAKTGKKMSIVKITDLIKYDLNMVKQEMARYVGPFLKNGRCQKDELT